MPFVLAKGWGWAGFQGAETEMRATILLAVALGFCGALAQSAIAGPRYRTHYASPHADPRVAAPFDPYDGDPYDGEASAAVVFTRHSARCEYPRGFNVTDFSRNLNGIPRGGDTLLATGCGSFEPFAE